MTSSLPEGIAVRRLTTADAEQAAEVMRGLAALVDEHFEATADELLEWWSYGDLSTDSWCLERDGRIVGFAWVSRHRDDADVGAAVRADCRGAGIGAALVDLSEQRARELGAGRIYSHVFAADEAGCRLLEQRGYRDARHFLEMVVDLEQPPPQPPWPDGIRPEQFRREDARDFHTALGTAFENEWGFVSSPFDEWLERRVDKSDTSLYFLARDGNEIAAVIRNEPERRGMGWVGALGVLPAWRRRGLGRAMLLHSFGAFCERGIRRVGLGVDSENPTGAKRLYESVGMHVTMEDVVYEKALT
jgi:ribosomal protein S18 acetylase RimI-like enzyme